MDAKLLSTLQTFADEQGNRLALTFQPWTPNWSVQLGIFSAESNDVDKAMREIIDRVQEFRRRGQGTL